MSTFQFNRCSTPGCGMLAGPGHLYCMSCTAVMDRQHQEAMQQAAPSKLNYRCAKCRRDIATPTGLCPACTDPPPKAAVAYHPANDEFNVLPPRIKQLTPGDIFTMSFYGKTQVFLFEAWNGATLLSRPNEQVWATVSIPLYDLTRFNARCPGDTP